MLRRGRSRDLIVKIVTDQPQRVASPLIHADISKIKGVNLNLGYGWVAIKTVRC